MRKSVFLSSLLLLSACRSYEEKMIVGKWNAAQLVECEDLVPINTSIVNLEFLDSDKYVFNSTLDIHEEGHYRIKNGYLYMKDQSKKDAPEKALYIKHVSNDTLILEMNAKGKDQFLTLLKEGFTQEVVAQNSDLNNADVAPKEPNNAQNTEGVGETVPVVSKEQYAAEMKSLDAVAVAKSAEAPPPTLIEKKPEKRPEPTVLTPAEAYKKREEKRKKEEASLKTKEKMLHEGYLLREKERKKEEAAHKREAENKTREREQESKKKKTK
jgi:hypothetical protein